MEKKDFLTIGLIVEDIYTDYTRDVVKSIIGAIPKDRDVRVVTIPGKMGDESDRDAMVHEHKTVYNAVYKLADFCYFDGLIVTLDSLNVNMPGSSPSAGCNHIPTVCISTEMEGCSAVKFDNYSGISEAVDMLINVGGLTKFAMLGGRESNLDVVERREIFKLCLAERGIDLPDSAYVETDMTSQCYGAAGRLLDQNPGVEAVFCVNDAVAWPLYKVMKRRGIKPGVDVKIFGFDNTRMGGAMEPPLASIGAKDMTLGKKAMEVLLDIIDGKQVDMALVPTMLYTRASLDYEITDHTAIDIIHLDSAGIDRLFDNCFYRYKNESYNREEINLRRLFNEIISRIIVAMKSRFMSRDEFDEICRMVDIFVDSNAMSYTDTQRFMKSLGQIQISVNVTQKSASASPLINRLFLRIKDRMIVSLSSQLEKNNRNSHFYNERMKKFLMTGLEIGRGVEEATDITVRMLEHIDIDNLLFYMYRTPLDYRDAPKKNFHTIDLRCLVKNGELYILPKPRQEGSLEEMFIREEMPSNCRGYVTFPVFCGYKIFGMLLFEFDDDICDSGELIASELGRALYLSMMV